MFRTILAIAALTFTGALIAGEKTPEEHAKKSARTEAREVKTKKSRDMEKHHRSKEKSDTDYLNQYDSGPHSYSN
jgi:Ni/Co efflux regulator RcnB